MLRARVNVSFRTGVSWVSVIQYDNLSDSIGINSRLLWEIEPGKEISFVVNQGWDAGPDGISGTVTDLTARVAWTLRY